jgi:hypothetical protein
MTTAYTSLLGLALPVTGELSGTWGDTVNNSITSLLDSAIAGTTTLSLDADVTLDSNDGTADTSRQAILLWTAGGTVTRNITAPAQSKIYTVINASSSTQSIVLRGAGPTTGVTIAKGESALCAWNGSDFIKISNTAGPGTFTNLTVTGNTTLGDAVTDTITVNSQFVTGTVLRSAQANTNTLSLAAYDVDGTAYTNLITLTASNTPTLTLTSTGVGTMNNIDIGGTAARTGAFTTLSATGAFSNNRPAGLDSYINHSTAGINNTVMGFNNSGSTNSSGVVNNTAYIGSLNAYSTWVVGNGAVIARFVSTAQGDQGLIVNGEVGIGLSNPSVTLETSTARSATATSAIFGLTGTGAVNDFNKITLKVQNTLGGSTGGAGIGAVLEASASNKTGLSFYYDSGSGAQTDGMRLDSSGNLGLGVTPSAWTRKAIQINDSVGGYFASNIRTSLTCNYYWSGANYYVANGYSGSYEISSVDGLHRWSIAANNSSGAGAGLTFTQAMTLDASGNLFVGATALNSNLNYFGYSPGNTFADFGHITGVASTTSYARFLYAGGEIGSITQNGTTGVLYNLTSDYRLKNNQEELTGAKDFIMALKPKKWQWWDGSGEGVGFVAHEFMEVAKHSGNGEKDAVDSEGKPIMQSIQPSSSEVMANLVAFVQELKAEFDAYKASHP